MSSESFECEIMSWDLFNELSKKVAVKMNEDNYSPDFMVGLARGGWVLSRVLCDYLGIKDLVSLKVDNCFFSHNIFKLFFKLVYNVAPAKMYIPTKQVKNTIDCIISFFVISFFCY